MPSASVSASLLALSVVLGLAASGCSPTAPTAVKTAPAPATAHEESHDHDHDHGHDHDHDHGHAEHDHPETLAEGIAQLAEAAAAVEKHLAAGATDAADDVVHGVGHIIEDIQGLMPKENLSAEAKAAAAKALDEVFECFDKLDTALHAPAGKGEPPAEVHAGLKDRIANAIKALEDAR
jgi:hypothetical protein